MGVHQKIDKVARRNLAQKLPKKTIFPGASQIIHFEGLNGPDGVKRKSPGRDEPWHYLDPHDPVDRLLQGMIADHIHNLIEALVHDNHERAAFEAAWMAHAITDGLTPAHHYPLEEKLEELRDGRGLETRTSTKDKLLLPGSTRRQQLRNNWEFWGTKGVMTTHLAFELGIATMIAGQRLTGSKPSDEDFARVEREGVISLFDEAVKRVAALELYEEFSRAGWTRRLARDTKNILIPDIIRIVTLAWYYCDIEASKQRTDHYQ